MKRLINRLRGRHYPLTGQIIWLTGASSGIGAALVPVLAAQCRHLVISARDISSLMPIAEHYPNVSAMPADVTDRQSLAMVAHHINEVFGYVDTLIANAGTCEYLDVGQFDAALVSRVMRTNFDGLVNTIDAALPLIRASQRGYLVAVSSSVTWLPLPRAEAYGASKAAVDYFMKSLRLDLAAEGIDVSLVAPGFVKTPLTDRNPFAMPMRISAEQAALAIVAGIQQRQHRIHFPKRFTRILQLLGALPDCLQWPLLKLFTRSQRKPRA